MSQFTVKSRFCPMIYVPLAGTFTLVTCAGGSLNFAMKISCPSPEEARAVRGEKVKPPAYWPVIQRFSPVA
jgi:hypothetical protein